VSVLEVTIVQKQFVSDLLEAIAGIAKHFVPLIQLSAEEKCARVTLQQEVSDSVLPCSVYSWMKIS
jgi:hypothetical protein